METEKVLLPKELPESCLEDGYDEVLFDLCRDDDYRGLYKEFVRRILEQS